MINTSKIKGKMAELQFTQKDIAKELGIAQSTVNLKINNVRNMSLDEAEKLCDMLQIKDEEFRAYFFAH